jgi:hypothetical protein
MTQSADRIWIKAGVNPEELQAFKARGVLYAGLALTGSLSLTFAALTVINLL